MVNFNNYIFRSSFVGNIVSVPKPLTKNQMETMLVYREKEKLTEKQHKDLVSLEYKNNESKEYKLTEGAKKLLNKIVFYEKHGRINLLEMDTLEKGNRVEKQARDLMTKVLGIPLVKDDERRTNEWVTGKRDINSSDVIFDIKAKFDFDSFNSSLLDSSNEVYLRQLDCYMELWELKDAILCHVLIDTPSDIIVRELNRLQWKNVVLDIGHSSFIDGSITSDDSIELIVSEINNHIYTREGLQNFCDEFQAIKIEWFKDFKEIPEKERVHMVSHSFDKERIEQRNECIKLARDYMKTVQPINNIITIN